MASACVNNVGITPENFIDCSVSYGWLTPRISFSRENNHDDDQQTSNGVPNNALPLNRLDPPEVSDLQVSDKDLYDFEFRLEDPVIMLPADELFSDGKLVPLLFPVSRPVEASSSRVPSAVRSSAALESCRTKEAVEIDPFLFSPKAPRCSSRWKELLGLKKLSLNANSSKADINNPSSHSTGINNGSKSRRLFLHRSSKSSCSSIESSLNIPLLKDLDSHSVTKSSRRSLSLCSSSCQEHADLPRLSLDSDKIALKQSTTSHYSRNSNVSSSNPPPRVRLLKQRTIIPSENQASARVGRSPVRRTPDSSTVTLRGVSMDSPRMNSSGKVIFQGLERSSSSPSTLNGGPPNNNKQRGMERSYSANVRVTPFLNVPVGSLSKSSVFGFQLFPTTPQKRGGDGSGSYSSSMGGVNRGQQQQQQQHQVSGRNRN